MSKLDDDTRAILMGWHGGGILEEQGIMLDPLFTPNIDLVPKEVVLVVEAQIQAQE